MHDVAAFEPVARSGRTRPSSPRPARPRCAAPPARGRRPLAVADDAGGDELPGAQLALRVRELEAHLGRAGRLVDHRHDVRDATVKHLARAGVGPDLDLLPDVYARQILLVEVQGHPDVRGVGDLERVGGALHRLPQRHLALDDRARDGRPDRHRARPDRRASAASTSRRRQADGAQAASPPRAPPPARSPTAPAATSRSREDEIFFSASSVSRCRLASAAA